MNKVPDLFHPRILSHPAKTSFSNEAYLRYHHTESIFQSSIIVTIQRQVSNAEIWTNQTNVSESKINKPNPENSARLPGSPQNVYNCLKTAHSSKLQSCFSPMSDQLGLEPGHSHI